MNTRPREFHYLLVKKQVQKLAARGYALPAQKYKKDYILSRLKTNREQHVADFRAAFDAHIKAAKEQLKRKKTFILKAIKDLGARLETATFDGTPIDVTLPQIYFNLQVPVSYVSHYDRAIEQLENCLATEIELDDAAYICFIEDNWDWKAQFETVTESYGLSKRNTTR